MQATHSHELMMKRPALIGRHNLRAMQSQAVGPKLLLATGSCGSRGRMLKMPILPNCCGKIGEKNWQAN